MIFEAVLAAVLAIYVHVYLRVRLFPASRHADGPGSDILTDNTTQDCGLVLAETACEALSAACSGTSGISSGTLEQTRHLEVTGSFFSAFPTSTSQFTKIGHATEWFGPGSTADLPLPLPLVTWGRTTRTRVSEQLQRQPGSFILGPRGPESRHRQG